MLNDTRIEKAIGLAAAYGGIDGDHHKMWVIDQMVRTLTGCPMVFITKKNQASGKFYSFEAQGESEQYKKVVRDACVGEDGPNTYEWDCGIAP